MDINSFVIGFSKGKKNGKGFYSTKENDAGGMTYVFKATESEGGGSMEGFHMVRFFNDDQTTLLYTVFVPTGASAMYAGETPESTVDTMFAFEGFQPAPTNVTADMDCFAVYSEQFKTLDQASWAKISELSADGTAQNFFAVGDTKMIHLEGKVGELCTLDGDYGVCIMGFDHNIDLEGTGITFGCFKSSVSNGRDLCLIASGYGSQYSDGTKTFNVNHWGAYNYGGWAGSDIRYDILGSTDVAPSGYGAKVTSGRIGYNPSETCAINPMEGTLMAALPADLRAVMKPMTKYTNNTGGSGDTEAKVTATIDYLPLLAEFEVTGARYGANSYEKNKQKQYTYYADGKSKVRYRHTDITTGATWATRSPGTSTDNWRGIAIDGNSNNPIMASSLALAPIFKV